MKSNAFLVIVLLVIPLPLASFEIPPSFLFPRRPRRFGAARDGGAVTPASGSADWIAGQVDRRDTGRDSRLTMQMRLFDRQGRARERTLGVNGLRGQGGTGDRVLVRFTYPNDIAGTGFLVWERPGGDDDRFLYLPALARVRRITGAERQESFVGSDFTYEDIGGRALDDYTYTLVDGSERQLDRLRRRPLIPRGASNRSARDADALYPTVDLPRPQGQLRRRRRRGLQPARRARQGLPRARRLSQVQGIWTVMASTMTNET